MTTLLDLVTSPVGPALVLLIGAVTELLTGRWLRRPGWLTGLALFFVAVAAALHMNLRLQPVVPVYSQPWKLFLQIGTNLVWVGDGWNWLIGGLILLLGGIGILLSLNDARSASDAAWFRRVHTTLAVHLGVLAAGLLFVESGNLLTAILTWVVLDIMVLLRGAISPEFQTLGVASAQNQTRGLSLVGAMLLLIGLLPAGPAGPAQPLQGGFLPPETIGLMLLASLIRAGIYPFHLWLLPIDRERVIVSERLLDHMVPVLSGLWLLGWTVDLGAEYVVMQPDILAILILALLCSALAAWTSSDQPNHTTFVLITSATLAALSGALAHAPGPTGMVWPTTAFALGGALWLVGDRAWRTWGWQVPVSVGALTLAGVPFTPGFLNQPALARLSTTGDIFAVLFGVYCLAQGIQIAALLRSWGGEPQKQRQVGEPAAAVRLLTASFVIGLPLAIAGFLPRTLAALASLPAAIPPTLGNPPTVVADLPVWIALVIPLVLGIGLVITQPLYWPLLGDWPAQVNGAMRLEWLFQVIWWLMNRASEFWGNAIRLVEGSGYMGWLMVFLLIGYYLLR